MLKTASVRFRFFFLVAALVVAPSRRRGRSPGPRAHRPARRVTVTMAVAASRNTVIIIPESGLWRKRLGPSALHTAIDLVPDRIGPAQPLQVHGRRRRPGTAPSQPGLPLSGPGLTGNRRARRRDAGFSARQAGAGGAIGSDSSSLLAPARRRTRGSSGRSKII